LQTVVVVVGDVHTLLTQVWLPEQSLSMQQLPSKMEVPEQHWPPKPEYAPG
jgi:hypothetical protein